MSHSPYPGSHTLCGPSLSMVQSSRLPSNPTQSILSKQMLFPLPKLPEAPLFKSRPQLCHQQRRLWQGASQGSKP